MQLISMLHPELVFPRLSGGKQIVLGKLAEHVSQVHSGMPAAEILDGLARRERLGSMCLGGGITFCHVRTEKVSDLVIALATIPDGVPGFETPDDLPVKLIALFLIPKKHSDLYLRVVSSLAAALSKPAVLERVIVASTPREAIAALQDDQVGAGVEAVVAQLARNEPSTDVAEGVLDRIPPVDLASMVEDLAPAERAKLFARLEPSRAAAIAQHMHLSPLCATLRRMAAEHAAAVLTYVEAVRTAEVIRRLSDEEQATLLGRMLPRGKSEVGALLKYPASKAGGFMTPEVVTFGPDLTVENALKTLAGFKDRRQTDAYVTSEDGRLLGKCTVQDLLLAEPTRPLRNVMNHQCETIAPERDHVDVRRIMAAKNVHSIAVVSREGKLLGVVTQDDLLDVIEREAAEDMALAVAGAHVVDPLHTPLWVRIKARMPWLTVTLGGELFIALVIAKIFQPTLEKAVVLAAFIPAIMATGGNVGLQATTMIIRGLGMGTLKSKHTLRLVIGEMRLGVLMGLMCGLMAGAVAYVINWHHHEVIKVSISVFLAMISATMATSLVGTLEPLILHKLKFDPAIACGPFVTMFNDMFGSIVYLLIAMLMNFTPPKG